MRQSFLHLIILLVWLVFHFACIPGPASKAAQGATDKHVELGLSLPRLGGFDSLPVQPEERFVALQFLEEEGAFEGPGRPMALVAIVPHAARRPGDARDGTSWLAATFGGWTIEPDRRSRERFGYRGRGVAMELRGGEQQGFAQLWEGEERDVVWLGICARADAARLLPRFRSTGERMTFSEARPDRARRNELERYYGQQRYGDVEGRIAVRLAMLDDWEATDSEHYIVLHHGSDRALLNRIAERMEQIRVELGRRFPATEGSEALTSAVAAVRVCRDRAEYLAYGGWQGTAGYWNPNASELVLYDARAGGGSEADLWLTIQHEATHQYLHAASGGIVPHPWFDEGIADWVSAAALRGGRIERFDPHPWRVELARELAPRASLAELLSMPQDAFYAQSGPNYALAWSFAAYLDREREHGRSGFAELVPRYWRALAAEYRAALEARGGRIGGRDLLRLQESVRARALELALNGVPLDELQEDWREYAVSLPRVRRG